MKKSRAFLRLEAKAIRANSVLAYEDVAGKMRYVLRGQGTGRSFETWTDVKNHMTWIDGDCLANGQRPPYGGKA